MTATVVAATRELRAATRAVYAAFILMGFANIYVAYAYSISTWATFKVFGLTGIMLVFMIAQGFYISRHLKDEDPPGDKLPAPPVPNAGQEST